MKAAALAILAGLAVSGLAWAQEPQREPSATTAMPQSEPQPVPEAAPKTDSPKTDAQKDAVPPPSGRFSFAPADGGYLRLDSTTGQVSFCSPGSAGWACQLVPDDRAALDAEIARLQDEVVRLKAEAAKPEPPRPQAELAPRSGQDETRLKLPSREEMEKAKAAFERAWRHFVDMVYDFQKDMTKKE